MNKRKLIFILGVGIPLLSGIIFSVWFIMHIKIYGTLDISYVAKSEDTLSQPMLKAHTPTGKEVKIPFINDRVTLSGFFKDAAVVFNCNDEIEKVTIINDWKQNDYSVNLDCISGSKNFTIPEDTMREKGFWKKAGALFSWFFSSETGQEIVLVLLVLFMFILSLFLFRQTRNNAKTDADSFRKRLLKQTFVFISGSVFWLIVLFVLCETGLRIFGSYYTAKQTEFKNGSDSVMTVLCLGDSFTYGIGAPNDKSYPSQLADLIREKEHIPVRVINAGICAGNSTQMLEAIQDLLQKYHPDLVVMLFGMANSWNYYGFSTTDNFLYRIRAYKLIVRIIENLQYKKSGMEMSQRINDFSEHIHEQVLLAIAEHKSPFDIAYMRGRYCLAKKDWLNAIIQFSEASSYKPLNDSARNALWICIEKMDYDFYNKRKQKKPVQHTTVSETMQVLDTLIGHFPGAADLKIIKYRYLAIKGDSIPAKALINSLCLKYPGSSVLYFDLEKVMPQTELRKYFESFNGVIKPEGFLVARGYYYLRNNVPGKAEQSFDEVLKNDANNYYAQIGKYAIALQKKNGSGTAEPENKYGLRRVILRIHEIIYANELDRAKSEEGIDLFINYLLSDIRRDEIESNKRDSIYYGLCDRTVWQMKELLHDDFFLIHTKKRSMNLKEQDVFSWIEKDINTITDICSKQGYPVICMNYPLIPPPNSEEISFWAAGVGEIWKKTAWQKHLIFVDQDSLFSTYNSNKGELFEPAFTGSEHCNERGYGLMALDIYECMKTNGFFGRKIPQPHKE
jgi:hypothetical protein